MLGPSRQKFCKCGEPLTEYVGFAYKHGDKSNDWLCLACEGVGQSPEPEQEPGEELARAIRIARYCGYTAKA